VASETYAPYSCLILCGAKLTHLIERSDFDFDETPPQHGVAAWVALTLEQEVPSPVRIMGGMSPYAVSATATEVTSLPRKYGGVCSTCWRHMTSEDRGAALGIYRIEFETDPVEAGGAFHMTVYRRIFSAMGAAVSGPVEVLEPSKRGLREAIAVVRKEMESAHASEAEGLLLQQRVLQRALATLESESLFEDGSVVVGP